MKATTTIALLAAIGVAIAGPLAKHEKLHGHKYGYSHFKGNSTSFAGGTAAATGITSYAAPASSSTVYSASSSEILTTTDSAALPSPSCAILYVTAAPTSAGSLSLSTKTLTSTITFTDYSGPTPVVSSTTTITTQVVQVVVEYSTVYVTASATSASVVNDNNGNSGPDDGNAAGPGREHGGGHPVGPYGGSDSGSYPPPDSSSGGAASGTGYTSPTPAYGNSTDLIQTTSTWSSYSRADQYGGSGYGSPTSASTTSSITASTTSSSIVGTTSSISASTTSSTTASTTSSTSTNTSSTSTTSATTSSTSPSATCGIHGYDKLNPPAFYFDAIAADANYAACNALSISRGAVSFGFNATVCFLYSSSLANNLNIDATANNIFYDVACGSNTSTSTSSSSMVSTTPVTTTTSSTSSTTTTTSPTTASTTTTPSSTTSSTSSTTTTTSPTTTSTTTTPSSTTSSSTVSTTTTISTTATTTTANGVSPPGPTGTGTVAGCQAYYVVKSGDYCYLIAQTYSITTDILISWNPSINSGCTNLQVGQAYCVSITKSTTTTSTTSSTTTSTPAPTITNNADYQTYYGNGTVAAGWPALSAWRTFDQMWSDNYNNMLGSCSGFNVPNNSQKELTDLKAVITQVATESSVDSRFIFAVILQESNACVRVPTTSSPGDSIVNPGLMQDHNGSGTCNSGGVVQNPCPMSEILQMVRDGTLGTTQADGSHGDGLVDTLAEATSPGVGVELYYRAARIYNGGESGYHANDLGTGCCTLCYSSDVANRLRGWYLGNSNCPFT